MEGSVIKYTREGNGIIRYSSFGEISTPYQTGIDIVVYGDSQTASYQVNDSENYVSVAEKELHANGTLVDLHNYGYPAGTIADYVYWASLDQSKLESSIVVIQTSTNDFLGQLGREGYIKSSAGSYFTKKIDATLSIAHEPIMDSFAFYKPYVTKSAFLGYGLDRLRLFRDLFANLKYTKQTPIEDNAVQEKSEEVITEELVNNYQCQITALHNAYIGQKVIIVFLPFSPVIKNNNVILENIESNYLLNQIRQFDDWYIIDPTSEFKNLWEKQNKLPRGFSNSEPGTGHLNVDGHAIVGHLLAEKIAELVK